MTIRWLRSRKLQPSLFMLSIVLMFGWSLPTAAQAAVLVVDDDGHANAFSCDALDATYSGVQLAINAAAPGDTVQVCPGVYDEQVAVTKSQLTIRGFGAGQTILRPSTVASNSTNVFSNPVATVLLVQGASNVTITSLEIDGSLSDGGASITPQCLDLPFFTGIYLRDSSTIVDTVHVRGIRSGTACAFAIRAEAGDAIVKSSLVDNYGEAGIACTSSGTRCTLTGNTIRGRGPIDDEIQAGIMVRSGAGGKISGNVITDHAFIGAHGVSQSAVGIFLVYATATSNPHIVRDNVFSNNQLNVQRFATAAAF